MNKWRNFEWHWINDNRHIAPDNSEQLGSPWKHGRAWFYHNLSSKKTTRTLNIEWVLWTNDFWHLYTSCSDSDEQVTFSFGCGLFAIWISLGNIIPRKWLPTRTASSTSSTKSEPNMFEMIQNRQIGIHLRHGSIDFSLWEDPTNWSSTQPKWWSFSFNVVRFVLGKKQNKTVEIYDNLAVLSLPEQNYLVHVFLKQQIQKRPRWFTKKDNYGVVMTDAGIPMPEKDGGTYLAKETEQKGITIEEVVANTVHWVLRERWQRWRQHEPR